MISLDPAGLTPGNFVARVAEAFESEGARAYLGEPLTLAEHMLQAATLAEERGMDDEIVVAALLHDIGHLVTERGACDMEDAEDRHHEETGARALRGYLPPVGRGLRPVSRSRQAIPVREEARVPEGVSRVLRFTR